MLSRSWGISDLRRSQLRFQASCPASCSARCAARGSSCSSRPAGSGLGAGHPELLPIQSYFASSSGPWQATDFSTLCTAAKAGDNRHTIAQKLTPLNAGPKHLQKTERSSLSRKLFCRPSGPYLDKDKCRAVGKARDAQGFPGSLKGRTVLHTSYKQHLLSMLVSEGRGFRESPVLHSPGAAGFSIHSAVSFAQRGAPRQASAFGPHAPLHGFTCISHCVCAGCMHQTRQHSQTS